MGVDRTGGPSWTFWRRGVRSWQVFGGGILASGGAGSCPRCGKKGDVRLAGAEGLIEKHLLAKLHIHPFRCLHCRSRFRRFARDPGAITNDGDRDLGAAQKVKRRKRPSRGRKARESMSGGGDAESFEAVIAEVREAELELERRESRKRRSDSIPRIG